MVINSIKTKTTTMAARQKHQLSPLTFDLVLRGTKIDQVSEHRLLGVTIDNKTSLGLTVSDVWTIFMCTSGAGNAQVLYGCLYASCKKKFSHSFVLYICIYYERCFALVFNYLSVA